MRLLKFEADWCQPCKTQAKLMEGMEYEAIDVETREGAALASKYGVRSLPTIILVDDQGDILQRSSGITSREVLNAWLS